MVKYNLNSKLYVGEGDAVQARELGDVDAPAGGRVRPGPSASYELSGRQFVTISMGSEVWSFTLDGAIPARGEAVLDPWDNYDRPSPAPRATTVIETATNIQSPTPNLALDVQSFGMDEHRFNPVRALVAESTSVRFMNNGSLAHTLAARDGSWTTERIEPGIEVTIAFDSVVPSCTTARITRGRLGRLR